MCQAGCFLALWSIESMNKNNLIFLTSRPPWFKLANSTFFSLTALVPCLCYIFLFRNLDFNRQKIILDYNYFVPALLILIFSLRNSRLHDETRDDTCATPMIRFFWHRLRFGCINELFLLCLKRLLRLGCSILLENSFHSRAFNQSAKEMCKSLNHIKTLF
jgi:hypothetical protein